MRLVIFDFDGTLADSAAWTTLALIDGAERHNYRRLDEAAVEALRGMDNRRIIRELGVPFWKLPLIARDMRRRMAEQAGTIPLFPGTAAMIEALAARGAVLAIVSSNSEENVRRILGDALSRRMALMECGASIFGKGRRLRRALRRAGFAPGQAIGIGDEARDIEAARQAGIVAGAVSWGYASRGLLESCRPDMIFDRMEEVAERLYPVSPGPSEPPGFPAVTGAAPPARG
ncbi:HAD hydrolase-like protein [Roseomonas sp. SSH11]|uniref:HAD hydrolase-like protein n=1 Tax=Pararoseomonas baculiformis TaxID=2820812 RepID=A0ABS4AIG3_9PROT|nr:HAD hydrolase-like protein [Pararoseomonas baculiformis]MBP0446019.1 HAD hydrolase-like protein [Pararoseomonas baculiformis]